MATLVMVSPTDDLESDVQGLVDHVIEMDLAPGSDIVQSGAGAEFVIEDDMMDEIRDLESVFHVEMWML